MVEMSPEHNTLSQLTLEGRLTMEDVQSRSDDRMTPIDQVGVSNIQYPIMVVDRDGRKQHTVAQLMMAVDLPHHVKGTHLSRFIEVLNDYDGELSMQTLVTILGTLKERLGAERARIEATFPYFLNRIAPVSGSQSIMDYECSLFGEANGKKDDTRLRVRVPVTALCPCSKEISDYGAHNQRGDVTIEVRSELSDDGTPQLIWIEDLIEVGEKSGSSPVYPLLKRPDERYVTMQAYDNPVFVEDMVREVATKLKDDPRVAQFSVHALNHESIHNHNAFARIDWTRPQV